MSPKRAPPPPLPPNNNNNNNNNNPQPPLPYPTTGSSYRARAMDLFALTENDLKHLEHKTLLLNPSDVMNQLICYDIEDLHFYAKRKHGGDQGIINALANLTRKPKTRAYETKELGDIMDNMVLEIEPLFAAERPFKRRARLLQPLIDAETALEVKGWMNDPRLVSRHRLGTQGKVVFDFIHETRDPVPSMHDVKTSLAALAAIHKARRARAQQVQKTLNKLKKTDNVSRALLGVLLSELKKYHAGNSEEVEPIPAIRENLLLRYVLNHLNFNVALPDTLPTMLTTAMAREARARERIVTLRNYAHTQMRLELNPAHDEGLVMAAAGVRLFSDEDNAEQDNLFQLLPHASFITTDCNMTKLAAWLGDEQEGNLASIVNADTVGSTGRRDCILPWFSPNDWSIKLHRSIAFHPFRAAVQAIVMGMYRRRLRHVPDDVIERIIQQALVRGWTKVTNDAGEPLPQAVIMAAAAAAAEEEEDDDDEEDWHDEWYGIM